MKASEHLEAAHALAKAAGGIMRENFTLGMKREWKHDATPLTKTDLDINALVLKELKKAFPEHRILAEEGNDLSGDSEYLWICDPVDGTHNFSHGVPTATFALALTHKGQPILGVIYDPFMDRLVSAEKGKGAHLNGKKISVSESPELHRTVIGMGKLRGVRPLLPLMEELNKHNVRLITGLSIHYMTMLTACGEFSASFFGGTSPYDMTPGTIIIQEAGGRTSDFFGKTPERYDRDMQGQICSNGPVHDELLTLFDRVAPVA